MADSTSDVAATAPGGESPLAAITVIEQLLDRGEPLVAYDRAQSELARWPDNVRLRQLRGLALVRGGDVKRANEVFAELAHEGHSDSETIGMLARTCKDLGLQAREPATRTAQLGSAFALYESSFLAARQNNAPAKALWGGINAAAMAVLLGNLDRARAIAAEVREIGGRINPAQDPGTTPYWHAATLGEAALILGDGASARQHYGQAALLSGQKYGDLGSTRRQAQLLASHLPDANAAWFEALTIPPVLVFTGNMIDRADRPIPRFPATEEAVVHAAIRERIAAHKPSAAYGSAACGVDLICLELAREFGAETHIVLPFPPEEFRKVSVDFAGGEWGLRFDRALAAANSVTIASDHRASQSAATWEYANLVFTGMGRLRAPALGTEMRGLVAWDPSVAGLPGGAASLVEIWHARNLEVDAIELAAPGRDPDAATQAPGTRPPFSPTVAGGMRHELRSLLFADAVGYSKLSEDQIPNYIAGFLGAVGDLSHRTKHRFEHAEVAGDGLYLVFRESRDAARFALELNKVTNDRDWTQLGLPATFKLRIALHCGPVYCGRDPVTGGGLFTGPHTSRASSIEPITPPGQVYASAAFAAVAVASGVDDLTLRYVGRMPLAKGRGMISLYHVDDGWH